MSNPIHGIEIEQIEHAAIKHVDVVDYANQQADEKSRKCGKLLEKAQTERVIDPETGVPKYSRRHGSQWMRVKTQNIPDNVEVQDTKYIKEHHHEQTHKLPATKSCCCTQ